MYGTSNVKFTKLFLCLIMFPLITSLFSYNMKISLHTFPLSNLECKMSVHKGDKLLEEVWY